MDRLKTFSQSIKESININDVTFESKFEELDVPYIHISASQNRFTVVTISLEDKKDWVNGYFENSKGAMKFMIYANGKINQLRIDNVKEFPDTRVADIDEAVAKIKAYLEKL